MKNAVILHGKPTRERYENPLEPKPHEANWLPWLAQCLKSKGIATSVPVFPRPYFPIYSEWKKVFEKDNVGEETSLIGHSAGAEFILRWPSENSGVSVERVFLVAPYKDYDGKYGDFSKYPLDLGLQSRIGRLVIIYSSDDDPPIIRRSNELVDMFPVAEVVELEGMGHFRIGHNMKSEEFPELLSLLVPR